jgi:hypothetical protein
LRRRGGPHCRESLGNGGHGASIKAHLQDGGGVGFVETQALEHQRQRGADHLWRWYVVLRTEVTIQ